MQIGQAQHGNPDSPARRPAIGGRQKTLKKIDAKTRIGLRGKRPAAGVRLLVALASCSV